MKALLTKTFVDRKARGLLESSGKPQLDIFDIETKGLGVRVGAETISVIVSISINRKKHFEVVGNVCELTPFLLLKEVAEGRLKALKKQRVNRRKRKGVAKETLDEVVKRYIAAPQRSGKPKSPKTAESYREVMDLTFASELQEDIASFVPARLRALYKEKHDALGPPGNGKDYAKGFWRLHGSLRVLKATLRWYARSLQRDTDPWPMDLIVYQTRAKPLPLQVSAREAMHIIVRTLRSIGTEASLCCEFLVFTGLRLENGRTLDSNQILRGVVTVNSKKGWVQIPVNRQALAVTKGRTGRVFNCTVGQLKSPLYHASKALGLGGASRVRPLSVHDLRKIFESAARGLGLDSAVWKTLMGRAHDKLSESYGAAQSFDILAAATQRVADYIDPPGNRVPAVPAAGRDRRPRQILSRGFGLGRRDSE